MIPTISLNVNLQSLISRKNKIKIEDIWLEFIDITKNDKFIFDLYFRVKNLSDKPAKFKWAVNVKDIVPRVLGRKDIYHVKECPVEISFGTVGTFNPLCLVVDFKAETVDIYDDFINPNIIAGCLPISKETEIIIKVLSLTSIHKGDKRKTSVKKLIKDCIKRNDKLEIIINNL